MPPANRTRLLDPADILFPMSEAHDSDRERPGRPPDPHLRNTLAARDIHGPVGQFGSVHGDVNMAPPRSAEEAAFRARYMARMQAEWNRKEEEERRANGDGVRAARAVFSVLFLMCFIVVIVVMAKGCSDMNDTKNQYCTDNPTSSMCQ